MMPKRMIAGNDWSPLCRVDDHAVIGPAKAMPVSTAKGTASRSPHDRVDGNSGQDGGDAAGRQGGTGGVPQADAGRRRRARRSGVAAIAR